MKQNVYSWTSQWLKQRGLPHEAHSLLESTNDLAKTNAFTDAAISVYLADQQSHGRGRGANTWTSPTSGAALLVTFSFELLYPPQHLSAPLLGLQIFKASSASWPSLNWSVKAPNDLYINDRKIAGILVETVSRGEAHRLLIGLGFNVFDAPKNVPVAGSLQNHLDAPVTSEQWQLYFSGLYDALAKGAELVGHTELSNTAQKELFAALKAHPEAEKLTAIGSNGDLHYSDRTVPWHEL